MEYMEATPVTVKKGWREKILLCCVSYLVPIIGVVIGFHHYRKKDKESKFLGELCIASAIWGFIFWWTILGVLLR